LQVAAGNPTPWTAFCHHAKLGMQEEFQSNWLNQKGEDEVLTNAFIQAKEVNFENLLQFGPNIKSLNSFTINNYIILEFITKYQSSLNIKISSEAFRSACAEGQSGLAAILLKNAATLGIDLNAKGYYDKTAFIAACEYGHADVAKVLMENSTTSNIDLNAEDIHGKTAFMLACREGHADVAKVLMENSTTSNIDLNAKTSYGRTAFIFACEYGKTSIVELMLDKADALQLDLTAKDSDGKTGFQRAQDSGKTAVVNLIKAKRPSIAV